MLHNTLNQPSKFRTKASVEMNDESSRKYNNNSQIKPKTSLLKSSLCHCSDPYIFVYGTITITGREADQAAISKINKTRINNAKYIHYVMPKYNSFKYSNNYSKTSERLWHESEATLFDSESLKSKVKITGNNPNNGNKKDVKIAVTLKY